MINVAMQKDLLALLGNSIAGCEFSKKCIGQTFYRSSSECKHALHVAFIPHKFDFDFTLDVAIRFNRAEELIAKFDKSRGVKPTANGFTMGVELGNLADGKPRRFGITEVADIPMTANEGFSFFKAVGLPYLDKYSDPERALDVLSGSSKASWLHSPVHSKRAISVVAMAWVYVGEKSALALARKEEEFLESRNEFGLDRFREFMLYLSQPN